MFPNFKKYFISGLLVLAPLFITVIVIGYLVKLTDRFIVSPLFWALPIHFDATIYIVLTKLAIALFVLVFVTLIGMGVRKLIFKGLASSWESLLVNIPLFNKIYFPVKDIAEAFFGDKSSIFKRVVFVEYPRKGVYAVAFLTEETRRWDMHEKTGKDVVSVFVPSPPNPATGNFIFVPREEVITSDMTIQEAVKLVISGGAVVPPLRTKLPDGTA